MNQDMENKLRGEKNTKITIMVHLMRDHKVPSLTIFSLQLNRYI